MELFFSYSHRDEPLRNELEKHLTMLRRQGVISSWHDRRITAGTEWSGAIDEHVESAQVILLLVSADFLHSEYCYDVEMRRALERQTAGDARVIPVIVRAVDWAGAPFAELQALPTDGRPITSWPNQDEAFTDVARGLRKAVLELQAARPRRREPSHYFAAQRQIIKEHVGGFVGRLAATEALEHFLHQHRRGYFIVSAGPGQGKTALAALWTSTRGYIHHFVSRAGGRSDVRLILCSMLEQLADPEIAVQYSAALPELAKEFEECIARCVIGRRDPLVLLIDALDELTGSVGDEAALLPVEALPEGGYVVVTARPGDRLDGLRDRLVRTPHEVYDLAPLNPNEIRAVVRDHPATLTEADVERLVHASRGSPLYVQTALSTMRSAAGGALELPTALDGYFRLATRQLPNTPILRDVLGVLSVARKPLTCREVAQITNHTERDTRTMGFDLIREYIHESRDGASFYHQSFHDFVTRELLYEDELRDYHLRIANWLQRPDCAADDYRWASLSYHLFESGDRERLIHDIDSRFLAEKVRRAGYAVLDDVELLTKSFLEADDPDLVQRCVEIVDELRRVIGSDIIEDATNVVQFRGTGVRDRRRGVVTPLIRTIPGVDLYVGILPKGAVTADFVEAATKPSRLLLAIGDAPSTGIKSAFVARFIANVFSSLVAASVDPRPADLLHEVSRRISRHKYFEWVSMQCVDIDLDAGRLAIANAGHPFPVLYAKRRQKWDCLPVRGELLHSGDLDSMEPHHYEQRHVEIEAGDVLVLLSDGLTEASARFHDPFGYRFADLIGRAPGDSARQIGESILEAWQQHPRAEDWADDVAVVVAVIERARR